MSNLRKAAEQALEVLERAGEELRWQAIGQVQRDLRAALAEPVLAHAPGYCKHCKQYTIEEPLPAEPGAPPLHLPGPL